MGAGMFGGVHRRGVGPRIVSAGAHEPRVRGVVQFRVGAAGMKTPATACGTSRATTGFHTGTTCCPGWRV